MKTAISIGVAACLLFACGGHAPPPAAPADVAFPDGGAGGSAPVLNAEKIVGTMREDFRKCYSEALASDPKAQGAVMIEAKLDPAGNVTTAAPTGQSALPPGVVDCISKRIQQAKFAPPGGAGSTLQIPISLKPGS